MDTQPLSAAPASAQGAARPHWAAHVAVLNPSYQAFVRGQAPHPPLGVSVGALLLLLFICAIGVYAIAAPVNGSLRWQTLVDAGVNTSATVTVRTIQTRLDAHGDHVPVYVMYYRYSVPGPDGLTRSYENRAFLPDAGGPQYGAQITIRYLPTDPGQSLYPGELHAGWLGTGVLALAGLVMICIGMGPLLWLLGQGARLRWLQAHGWLVPGTVTAVGPARPGKTTQSAPVTVAFISPTTGRQLAQTQRVAVADVARFPAIGRPVAVLYRSDTQYQAL
jgi:hypothetical protein